MTRPLGSRERVLFAAQRVIDERGPATTTSREVAAAARLSETSPYQYIDNKTKIFLSMLRDLPTGYSRYLAHLPQRAGEDTVQRNLEEFLRKWPACHAVARSALCSRAR